LISPTDISADFSGTAKPQGSHVKLTVTQETMNETFLQLFSPILDNPVASAIADEAKDSGLKPHIGPDGSINLDMTKVGHKAISEYVHVRSVTPAPGNRLVVKFDADP
jgi:hypothetical protein